ncbi:hypothetical protein [Mycobacterium sp. AT1]|uniref:hypothetical protein n=1 Tax=Mycobacterium sp. AT1 TaxID=1961706 RepID=UPI0009AE40A4|nr:hypothetical protein [Mycobacterium sp. AT1]OPX08341.1 hypothetical protein B1790_19780 [Mycobacterium sp. AT1]
MSRMTEKRRATDADYEQLARSYAAEPPRADEINGTIEVGSALRTGRDKELAELMDEVARGAEAAPDEDDGVPLPPHVKVSPPDRTEETDEGTH